MIQASPPPAKVTRKIKGFELRLSANCLSHPLASDMAEIHAAMLWPDNKETRIDVVAAILVDCLLSSRNSIPEVLVPSIMNVAAKSVPLHERREQNGRSDLELRGIVAGMILNSALSTDMSMKKIIQVIARTFDRATRLGPKTIENSVWPTFKPVAHLWAAWTVLGDEQHFPCAMAMLPTFLAWAEGFRLVGEKTKTKQSPTTILLACDMARLPCGLAVVPINIFEHPRPL